MQMTANIKTGARPLTRLQQQWLTHLQRAEAQQQSVAEYARANGLDADAMHRWRSQLKQRGVVVVSTQPASFVRAEVKSLPPVSMSTNAPMLRVVLSNGIVLEVPHSAALLADVVRELSVLP
jgi:hypothetical protein